MKPMRHHMTKVTKILNFSRFSLRDLIVASGPTILAIAAVCVLAYVLVDPAPPRVVTLSTGQENGAYEAFGKKYAELLGKHGIKVVLKPSMGPTRTCSAWPPATPTSPSCKAAPPARTKPSGAAWCRWAACSPSRCGCSCART